MLIEITDLIGKDVFTHKGTLLGKVDNVLVDLTNSKVHELVLAETNPNIIEESRNIGIPFRWVQSIADIIVLRYFPGKVKLKKREFMMGRVKRKLRVVKSKWGEGGISRTEWR